MDGVVRADRNRALALAFQAADAAGNTEAATAAWDELYNLNRGMIGQFCAAAESKHRLPVGALLTDCALALRQAALTYSSTKAAFGTHLYTWLWQACDRGARQQTEAIRVPENAHYHRMRALKGQPLQTEHCRPDRVQAATQALRVTSLDMPVRFDSETPLAAFVPDPHADTAGLAIGRADHARLIELFWRALRGLPPQQRRVLVRHYWRQQSFRVIGAELGVSHEAVSSVHQAALKRLRCVVSERWRAWL